ncbi:hypothetical protein [Streptomyces sp. SID12488]|uniref:DUF7352 domain-containing protein n=1 Tax=Streptomyces sp. SID12488 TaxID=2706040 RepID=UPI0013DC4C71|nr:hypothetical protein [Streptomyces sp. SID12488]NEA61356.1 hypothetical protein [Streptomyces sp. SID12488]
MTRRMLRHRIYVTGQPQTRNIHSDPVHVAADRIGVAENAPHVVDFWAEGSLEEPGTARTFLVVGTGHPIPDGARHRGTTPRTPDGMVWHLYELPPA